MRRPNTAKTPTRVRSGGGTGVTSKTGALPTTNHAVATAMATPVEVGRTMRARTDCAISSMTNNDPPRVR